MKKGKKKSVRHHIYCPDCGLARASSVTARQAGTFDFRCPVCGYICHISAGKGGRGAAGIAENVKDMSKAVGVVEKGVRILKKF